MKKLVALLLLAPAGFCWAQEKEEPKKEKAILFPQDPSEEDFDYPIVTDENYPFLMERDNFQPLPEEE